MPGDAGRRAAHRHRRSVGHRHRAGHQRHGGLVSVPTAKRIAGTEAGHVPIVHCPAREVVAYSPTERIYSKTQRFAFTPATKAAPGPAVMSHPPGAKSTRHPLGTRRHNLRRTGAVACDHHHDELDRNGYVATMINGSPTTSHPLDRPRSEAVRSTLHDL